MDAKSVGLIGLGRMGSKIAANLAAAGRLAVVYNRTHSKAEEFGRSYGVEVARSVSELASRCDVIVSVLADDKAVLEVSQGLFEGDLGGKLVVDMSTISPRTSIELSERFRARGASMFDAPIIGAPVAVERREAVVLLGGPRQEAEKIVALLKTTAREVYYVGPNGSGLYLKLVNNLLLGSTIAALAEAVRFGLEAGLEPAHVEKLFADLSSLSSPAIRLKGFALRRRT